MKDENKTKAQLLSDLEALRRQVSELERQASGGGQLGETPGSREDEIRETQRIARLGTCDWDLRTEKIRWSDQMFQIYGLEMGPPPDFDRVRQLIVPEDRHILDEAVQSMARRDVYDYMDYRIKTSGRSIRHLHVRARALVNEKGEIVKLVGIVLDLTEQREAELHRPSRLLPLHGR